MSHHPQDFAGKAFVAVVEFVDVDVDLDTVIKRRCI